MSLFSRIKLSHSLRNEVIVSESFLKEMKAENPKYTKDTASESFRHRSKRRKLQTPPPKTSNVEIKSSNHATSILLATLISILIITIPKAIPLPHCPFMLLWFLTQSHPLLDRFQKNHLRFQRQLELPLICWNHQKMSALKSKSESSLSDLGS
jgi:hypothetical protein